MRWPDKISRAGRVQRHKDTGSSTQLVLGAALQRADLYAANESFRALAQLGSSEVDNAERPDAPEAGFTAVRTMLLKPVGDRCNLGCPYCYEEDRRSLIESGRLSLAEMAKILDRVLPFVGKPFDIFVHGGEPLLTGKAFFEDLIAMVKDHPYGSDVSFGVQTNAVLIDRDWAEFFATYNFSVGVSLDGPPEIHDKQRPTKQGRGTYDAVLAGLRILNEAQVPVGVTSVISAPHARMPKAAADLFDHFIAIGITRFDTHPAFAPIGPSQPWNLSPEEYASFMCDLFDHWVAHGDPSVIIRSFEEFFRSMTGFSAQTCFR